MEIELVKGDITKEKTDAIVNAANNSLLRGGGVDGAIHRAGGPLILEECKAIRSRQGGCPTGEAVYTSGGNLLAKFVIHTVGPVWKDGTGQEKKQLQSCYLQSMQLAEKLKIKSIAFPNISTGVYGFPKKEAAQIAIETIKDYKASSIELVRFVCFDEENYHLYKDLL